MNNHQKDHESPILTDEEIISLYWQRQERAIEATDSKYRKYLYTIANNILNDNMDSEECLNDTYLSTWNAIPPTKPARLQAFLSKITRNTALGKIRTAAAGKRIPSELSLSLDELDECIKWEPGEDEKYFVNRLGELLNEYLETLEDRQLFIFICRYYYSDPVVRIAEMLMISKNTVFRELAEIRNGLKQFLEKEGYNV